MLQKALENLEKANARALGVVLNKVPRRGAAGGYYGDQYQSYQAKERVKTPRSDPAAPATDRLRRDNAGVGDSSRGNAPQVTAPVPHDSPGR